MLEVGHVRNRFRPQTSTNITTRATFLTPVLRESGPANSLTPARLLCSSNPVDPARGGKDERRSWPGDTPLPWPRDRMMTVSFFPGAPVSKQVVSPGAMAPVVGGVFHRSARECSLGDRAAQRACSKPRDKGLASALERYGGSARVFALENAQEQGAEGCGTLRPVSAAARRGFLRPGWFGPENKQLVLDPIRGIPSGLRLRVHGSREAVV